MKNEFQIKLENANNIALFTQKCSEFDCDVDYKIGRYTIDAKSIMGVLSIGIGKAVTVKINTNDKKVVKDFYENIKLWITEEEKESE